MRRALLRAVWTDLSIGMDFWRTMLEASRLEKKNSAALTWILQTFMPDRKVLGQARRLCLDKDWSEGASLLMEQSAAANASKRFEFD